ncbi:IclR family transcriptional regulator [Acinetobacter sp. ANC 3813]|uniref:IclR family transcriptional regulator n=1 Tax=Acinetobacter sp. ANC 3813 TaxID=1977873 RepID=UPI000A33D18B|nr:IclR family transcriptional regulator [Acinetobacter sp. ANC 3813]OTG91931.1 IclR family transcriptional regulator [Acinetobacter sp. ANC 3813]
MANEITKEVPLKRQQKVQAAELSTDILKGLADLAPSTTLSGLSEHLNIPASKLHRYLQALLANGFAEQDPETSQYKLGPTALYVAAAALGSLDVVKIAKPFVHQLCLDLQETCFLAIWGNQGPTVIHLEEAIKAFTMVTKVGSVLPLMESSTGQVFCAYIPEDELKKTHGIDNLGKIRAKILKIREHGMNQIHGKVMTGVNAMSAPIFNIHQRIVGVITVIGMQDTFNADFDSDAAKLLLRTAREASYKLGCNVDAM